MVRATLVLARIPVIKFRKGGAGGPAGGQASCPAAAAPAAAQPQPQQSQPAAAMSTGAAIPDIDLPARYQRQPLSQEEIDHINGGGIV
ncbi:uncharacterized protein LOC135075209 [Ostrinia nubilalis]|uniref:uncharacterized protein LOC114354658 n=1 Tax=Ostrinia furnacalis TaxID=93504 RepID=UPI001038F0B3|nr:uncharacterized protein LOC114354658 [Ostrinia furnacalis]